VESNDQVECAVEVLTLLTADQSLALVLQAAGFSYEEISERTGWSYSKVNRCIRHGRRKFKQRFDEIESGEDER
jgi:DNA-directed RNA polymerase specialized sigma24 family protein